MRILGPYYRPYNIFDFIIIIYLNINNNNIINEGSLMFSFPN